MTLSRSFPAWIRSASGSFPPHRNSASVWPGRIRKRGQVSSPGGIFPGGRRVLVSGSREQYSLQYIYFGGYPGSADLIRDEARWKRYILDSMMEATLSRDILQTTRIDKPALLRQLFNVACSYSGQILSYTKIVGQLQDAGNTTTLAHYLGLLEGAGMAVGLQKYAGQKVRQRGSSPKFQVLNGAFMTCQSELGFAEAKEDPAYCGRLVESAVGAHLVNESWSEGVGVFYWREGEKEVDFVVQRGKSLTAMEVKSVSGNGGLPGVEEFAGKFRPKKKILIGGDGVQVGEFLCTSLATWIA